MKMVHYDRIDNSEGNGVSKSPSKECDICQY